MQKLRLPTPHPVGGGPWYLLELVEFEDSESLSPQQAAAGGWAQPTPTRHSLCPIPWNLAPAPWWLWWLVGKWRLFRTRVSTFAGVGN